MNAATPTGVRTGEKLWGASMVVTEMEVQTWSFQF